MGRLIKAGSSSLNCGVTFQWEIKGRFRKRVVLANVPSFRFSFRGNIRRNHPFAFWKSPFCQHPKGSLGDKRAVSKRVVLANVPSFRFSFRGNIAKTTLLETALLGSPELLSHFQLTPKNHFWVIFESLYLLLDLGSAAAVPTYNATTAATAATRTIRVEAICYHWHWKAHFCNFCHRNPFFFAELLPPKDKIWYSKVKFCNFGLKSSARIARIDFSESTKTRPNNAQLRMQKLQKFSTALLLNEVSEKSREIWNEVSESFSEIWSEICPEIRPEIFALSWQVEKSSPKISPDFSHRKFQNSNRIPNQISPKISQTHFCRLGSPNKNWLSNIEFLISALKFRAKKCRPGLLKLLHVLGRRQIGLKKCQETSTRIALIATFCRSRTSRHENRRLLGWRLFVGPERKKGKKRQLGLLRFVDQPARKTCEKMSSGSRTIWPEKTGQKTSIRTRIATFEGRNKRVRKTGKTRGRKQMDKYQIDFQTTYCNNSVWKSVIVIRAIRVDRWAAAFSDTTVAETAVGNLKHNLLQ